MKKLNDFPYKNVLVLGLAKSGSAAAKLLHDSGINVKVNDLRAEEDDVYLQELKGLGINVVTGSHPLSLLEETDLVIKNPGIPYENPLLEEAAKKKIPILTEIELAGRLIGDRIIGITGSNGKTTTTTLVYEMLKEDGKKVKPAGNIGEVATEVARNAEENEQLVMELSSFQLMGIDTFKPKISMILNLFEAHLDYHKTFEKYKEAKGSIFKNQTSDDFLIFNKDDEAVTELANRSKAQKIPFSVKFKQVDGAWTDEQFIYFKEEKIVNREEVVLVGNHNLENILAAVAAAKLSGVKNSSIQQVLRTFSGVKHRLQYVKNINGRFFYNDSKATNILATTKALSSFQKPLILLAGGLDRGNDFKELTPHLSNVKAMVLFGETASKLEDAGREANVPKIVKVNDMEEAVRKSFELSDEGDTVLLSPACASWDQYKTFEERGNLFIDNVQQLAD